MFFNDKELQIKTIENDSIIFRFLKNDFSVFDKPPEY